VPDRAEIATATAIDRESDRMDSALTYALFTLIGIAGEDDLDAPNLAVLPAERQQHAAAGAQNSASFSAVWLLRREELRHSLSAARAEQMSRS
jgi:hypothetical protein